MFVIEIDPVMVLNVGVPNKVKFLVSLAVSVYVDAKVPPYTLNTKICIIIYTR